MARHATDLLPMLHILAEDNAPLLELETEVNLGKLKVFWLEDDGGFPVITPVHRFSHSLTVSQSHRLTVSHSLTSQSSPRSTGSPPSPPLFSRELREAQRKLVKALQKDHPSMQVERAPGLGDLFHSLPIWFDRNNC